MASDQNRSVVNQYVDMKGRDEIEPAEKKPFPVFADRPSRRGGPRLDQYGESERDTGISDTWRHHFSTAEERALSVISPLGAN